MNQRERLTELLASPTIIFEGGSNVGKKRLSYFLAENIADKLIANGVTLPPCKIGDKIYDVMGEPGEKIDIVSYTVSEVGLNGVFVMGGFKNRKPHRQYFPFADEGVWWYLRLEDAEAERKRRDDP